MGNTIAQLLSDPNHFVLVVGIALGVIAWWIVNNYDKLKLPYEWLMSWHNSKKHKEELIQMLLDDHQETVRISKEVDECKENSIHDREQSLKIQEEWTKKMDALFDKMDEIQKNTNARFEEMEEKNNKRVRAELKSKISDSYRYYHEKGKINDMEFEALEDLIEEYESAKGQNSFVHSVVQKEMYTWEKVER